VVSETKRFEVRGSKEEVRRCPWLLLLFFILTSNLAPRTSSANELSVDKRTITLTDSLTITLTLTDSFAQLDSVRLNVQNLAVDGEPSTSSEFQWINGQTFRRKVFRWSAHAKEPGAALVGPIALRAPDGQVDTLAPLSIQVLPDATAGSNDPAKIMRELMATGRVPVFIVAEADRERVFAGDEVVVTWTMYSATTVQQWGIGELPRLADFWTEELDVRAEQPQQLNVGGQFAQRLVIRRVALFPLRSGTLDVDPMAVNAAVMRRTGGFDPFGVFEGTLVEVRARSAPLRLDVQPVPAGPPVDVVGDVSLECFGPVQSNGGPVTFDVVLGGRANLRAARPPRFAQPLDGSVQIAERPLTVQRAREEARMARRWRYLVFPASNGAMVIPPLASTELTSGGERRELRCAQRVLLVKAAEPPRDAAGQAHRGRAPRAAVGGGGGAGARGAGHRRAAARARAPRAPRVGRAAARHARGDARGHRGVAGRARDRCRLPAARALRPRRRLPRRALAARRHGARAARGLAARAAQAHQGVRS
jgi:hypothetical protein